MGHYAKVINGLVVDINVATQEWVDEQIDKWMWIEASYNIQGGVYYDPITNQPHKNQSLAIATPGRKRKNYPGLGWYYNIELDAFIPPTPYPSWKLNEDTCLWEPPIPYPNDSVKMGGIKQYFWNEQKLEFTYAGYKIINGELIKDES